MDPLVIIATPNICWLKPDVDYPKTAEAVAEEGRLCLEAGAAVLHMHAEERWIESINAVRAKSDIIVQCGMSSQQIPERMDIFKGKGDMISIILNHHDEAFVGVDCNVLHLKSELEEYCRLCTQYGVKPEFEVWHTGSIWSLNYLINKGLLKAPYITTMFFGWPGGTWSPPTIEEYMYRRKNMPEGCVCPVSIMGKEQRDILAAAIVMGDHVRVGTEDYPFNHAGKVVTTHELVQETADMARALGRRVATVQEARAMMGL